MAEKVGVFNRLFLSSGAADSGYTQVEFMEGSGLGLGEQFLPSTGLVGTRSHAAERTRRGLRQVNGQLAFQPTPAEFDLLLPWALGGTKSGNNIPLAETVPFRWLRTDRDGTFHIYNNVKVSQITFSASEGSILGCQMQVAGFDEATSTVPTFTALDNTGGPYVMHDCVLSVGGTEYPFRNWQLTLNNVLEVRHNNSVTPTAIHATDRDVTVAVGLPYGDASALYGSAIAGVAMVATFTQGSKSIVFTCPAIQAPRQPLELGTRAGLTLSWAGAARKSGSTAELTVDNDST